MGPNGNEIGIVLTLLVLPALFVMLRTIFGWISRAESAKLERTLEELDGLVTETDRQDRAKAT